MKRKLSIAAITILVIFISCKKTTIQEPTPTPPVVITPTPPRQGSWHKKLCVINLQLLVAVPHGGVFTFQTF